MFLNNRKQLDDGRTLRPQHCYRAHHRVEAAQGEAGISVQWLPEFCPIKDPFQEEEWPTRQQLWIAKEGPVKLAKEAAQLTGSQPRTFRGQRALDNGTKTVMPIERHSGADGHDICHKWDVGWVGDGLPGKCVGLEKDESWALARGATASDMNGIVKMSLSEYFGYSWIVHQLDIGTTS